MQAAPMEDFERLEREVMELREAMIDFFSTMMLVDDKDVWRNAATMCHEALKERKEFRPDFEMEWEIGADREVRFDPEPGDDGA